MLFTKNKSQSKMVTRAVIPSEIELSGHPRFHFSISRNSCLRDKDSKNYMDRVKRIWYLSPMRVAKVQASLRICAVSPEPSLLAHTISESRGTVRQKARSLAPLNDWACAVKICHDGMPEDTNSLDGAHIVGPNHGCTVLL